MVLSVTEWRLLMQATNIRLPEDLLKALRHRAIEEKKSMNQLIREAIEMSLATVSQFEEREKDPLEDVIGIAKSGIKDASSKHDRYLYRRRQ
jgi:metal-responsive CopG/Arc/MetJ family transcriptional regulator